MSLARVVVGDLWVGLGRPQHRRRPAVVMDSKVATVVPAAAHLRIWIAVVRAVEPRLQVAREEEVAMPDSEDSGELVRANQGRHRRAAPD